MFSIHTPHDLFSFVVLVYVEDNWGDIVVAIN